MLELGWLSARLFLKGKLLRDPIYFMRQTLIGSTIGLLVLLLLAQAEIPFCLPVTISSLTTGIIMPFLLKDFKMK
ncbi:conserved hypothetical protein [Trichormus variabilis ATCC 29413]|uniref:Uncharacterized protein n=3 Tax=Anabaena variabilis TaxID=264691 RepID=Q3M491_TRIV2|nr:MULTISPECIES: hypothetical protein [Nostocaceae]ABA24195.1 conserved hypothetical protein [Trichormus variabilis ATCC 29413]MBC1216269.1 hypothetical protein [Trichormus variabilis ARAD]MBC1256773.1 hypothetical protein [Trichormus variabilis V5]MBC1268314.1 hypothetical protein [Trichormus variabilis FSR]MBC1304725.1 hypothetical protein [Trichormus variabilis N2B]